MSDSGGDSGGKVPQKHGGALLTGGKKGNKGGRGIPSRVREACRLEFESALPVLVSIASDQAARTSDRIKAIEVLAKYGGVDKLALTVEEQSEQEMTPERAAELVAKVMRIKRVEDKERFFIEAARKQLDVG